MVDFDQIVRPEMSMNVWGGRIKKEPEICTDLGGTQLKNSFFIIF